MDPFGIKGLDSSTYRKALQGPQDEIFALFADAKTPRLYGLVIAKAFDLASRLEEIRESPSLFQELDQAAEEEARRAAAEHQHALDLSQPAAREVLNKALSGSYWEAALRDAPAEQRPGIFLQLFIDELVRAGARFIMTMPMREESGQVAYTLVHASKSEVALITMKDTVSSGLNKPGLLPPEVLALMRADLSVPMSEIYHFLRSHFAGQEVLWADLAKPALLIGTGVFHFQLAEIKEELKTAGWLAKGADRKEYCRVPPT